MKREGILPRGDSEFALRLHATLKLFKIGVLNCNHILIYTTACKRKVNTVLKVHEGAFHEFIHESVI